jgi:hypothetical protein
MKTTSEILRTTIAMILTVPMMNESRLVELECVRFIPFSSCGLLKLRYVHKTSP